MKLNCEFVLIVSLVDELTFYGLTVHGVVYAYIMRMLSGEPMLKAL